MNLLENNSQNLVSSYKTFGTSCCPSLYNYKQKSCEIFLIARSRPILPGLGQQSVALLEQVDAQPQREVVLLQLVDLLLVLPQVQEAPAAAAAGQAGGRAALRHGVARCWNRGQRRYRPSWKRPRRLFPPKNQAKNGLSVRSSLRYNVKYLDFTNEIKQ